MTAACGSDDDDASDGTDGGGNTALADCETIGGADASVSSLSELDFSGLDINVGSKDFVEQFVLGQLAIVGLEAGGATVTDSTNLGGTVVNRDALVANEIDTYFEYNGTGWTVHLAQEDPSFDAATLSNDVCSMDLQENNIRWVGVSPFNDTYGFATAADSPAAGGNLQAMMEYVNDNSGRNGLHGDGVPQPPRRPRAARGRNGTRRFPRTRSRSSTRVSSTTRPPAATARSVRSSPPMAAFRH